MYTADTNVWLAFAIYLGATFFFAYLSQRRAAKTGFMEDFFVAGRSIGPWVLGLTWIATAASGGTFIGSPALAHTYGWSVMLWICSYMVVATTGFGLFGKRVAELGRRTGALTFPDLLRDRFESQAIGTISGVAIIVLYIAYLVAQYVAGARVIEAVMGVPYQWGVLGFALTVSLYTAYGGFRAVAWTDAFQAVVMLVGVLITVFYAVSKLGGLQAIYDGLQAQSPELLTAPGPEGFLPVPAAISFFCVWALAGAAQPSTITRFLACRDTRALKRACFLIGIYIALLYPCVIGIGIMGRVLAPELEAADHATPATILAVVPPTLAGFVLAAPLAAIMSTISSFLLVTSSALVRDLYERNLSEPMSEKRARNLSQLATFAVAGAALVFALRPPDFLQYIVVFAGTGLAATFFFPTILGIYWPRMNKAGCMAGIIGGFVSFLFQYLAFGKISIGGFDPFVWSMIVSCVSVIAVSLATAPGPESLRRRYFPSA
ncbi:MAG TPA: sodium/pantothenate symporter [Bryobacterales bacterium]|nr:sodium/pantothenate symporter [Bryobacterales bacterium]